MTERIKCNEEGQRGREKCERDNGGRGLREAIKNGLLAEFTALFHEEQNLGDIASIK